MTDDIKLSPQEFEDLKDDVKWRATTTLSLKILIANFKSHEDTSIKFREAVTSLQVHKTIQYGLISGIFLAIMGSAIWIIRSKAL